MNFWTPAEFQRITQGRWIREPSDLGHVLRGLGIDSRTIGQDQVFVAIKGKNFDGHDYVSKAIDQGAALAIIDRDDAPLPDATALASGVLLVDDCVVALQSLARVYRDILAEHEVKVIGVTGSNGKTTTRHLIHAVLSAQFRGTQSPKSFNNHLGVPLTILGASIEDDFLVAEVGTNHPGEIAHLAEILRPDIGVITMIGCAHDGHFDGRAGIAREKSSLLRHVTPDGFAVISRRAHAYIMDLADIPSGLNVRLYGFEEAQDFAAALVNGGGTSDLRLGGRRVRFPLLGKHNIENALGAIEVARLFEMDQRVVADTLEAIEPVPMRLQVIEMGVKESPDRGVTVINDSYNSNPDSLFPALEIVRTYRPRHAIKRRVAILGDMLELGEQSQAIHARLVNHPEGYELDLFIAIGRIFRSVHNDSVSERALVRFFPDWFDALPEKIAELLQPNDIVLIKGSRGMQLERLIPAIEERFGKQQD